MNALDASCDAEKNPDGLDFVLQGSRINLLENKVVLAVPEGNPKGIESFDALAEALKAGDTEKARKFAMRSSKLSPEIIESSKKLLTLMGI